MTERLGILWFVLDEPSAKRLRQIASPKYSNEFYHHVTLQYGVEEQTVAQWIGQKTAVEAYAVASNTEAQACRVRTQDLPDMYGVPHITLSTAKGIEPYASVAMLQGDHNEVLLEVPTALTGTIAFEPLA